MYEPNDGGPFGMIMFMVIIAVYCYFAYAQYRIAQKTGHPSPWMAWVPIANTFQLIDMANKQWFWILLLLVPASVGLMVLTVPIVKLVYQRGTFTDESALMTSSALFYYAAGIAAAGLLHVVNRAYYSLKDTRTPFVVALALSVLLNSIERVCQKERR